VISLNRFEKNIIAIRRIRRFRKAARLVNGITRTWLPLFQRARKQVLSSVEYQRKLQEEMLRKEAERQAEIKRLEEEARIKREMKEAKMRAREEAKRALEEQRRYAVDFRSFVLFI
jgi:hypothetical protein